MKKEIYPRNKQHLIKLGKFANEILDILEESKINPVIYGSYMIFYYTRDKSMKVNDIDFYIRDKEIPKLIDILKKNKIDYSYSKKWHTLSVEKGRLKLEFDSIDFFFKGKKEFTKIDFFGREMKVLSKNSLKRIYKRASEVSEDNPEGNLKKYLMLEC